VWYVRVVGQEVRAAITGVGYATPRCLVTSGEVEDRISQASGRLPVPPGTIAKTTGIDTRYMVGPGEYASSLAADAARRALDDAGIAREDIDLLVFASASQDQVEPATAHIVADILGLRAPGFDAKNACNSFVNGVEIAEAFIRTGRANRVLVVSGETPTLATRWAVRSLKELRRSFIGYTLGDLGTAAVVEAATDGRGVFYRAHHAESRHWRIVGLPGGGARHPGADPDHAYLEGDGNALRDAFMGLDPDLVLRVFRETGTTWDDYAIVCAHQVTAPFTDDLVRKVGLPRERLVTTIERYGNVGSGTLPLGLALAREQGRVRPGDRVLWIGLGAGISVATMAFVL
jgi:3-oxoacyl-(acyl-carrier-protein) synthase III